MASWELSPLYRHTSSHLLPDSHRLVSVHQDRVVLRNVQTLQVLRTWTLPLPTSRTAAAVPAHSESASAGSASFNLHLAVSPSAPFLILVSAPRQRVAFVLHPDQDGLYARLDIGNEGVVAVDWAQLGPEGEQVVLSWSAHHLRLSLFRVSDPSNGLHILNPKHSHPHGYSFRPDGAPLAVLERHNSRDVIGIYSTTAWTLMRTIPLQDPNSDLADLAWSPCGHYIAAWSAITDYSLHIFTPDGRLLSTFAPYASLSAPTSASTPSSSATGSHLQSRKGVAARAPAPVAAATPRPALGDHDRARSERSTAGYVGLGIRCVRWAPDGAWLAVGGWDGKVRILSRHGWQAIAELGLPTRVVEPVVVWREPVGWVEKTRGKGIVSFDLAPLPHSLTPLAPNFAAPVPRMGIARLEWSPSGRWIATWNAAHPHLVAIYAFPLASATVTLATTRPYLHTLLAHVVSPSHASTSGAGPASPAAAPSAGVRSFAWQPPVMRANRLDEHGEPIEDLEETLVLLVGDKKGFTLWRSPSGTTSSGGETGIAECVGIPARADVSFNAATLSFATDGRSMLLSASGSGGGGGAAGGANGEGTFCIAYPVYEEEEDGAGAGTGADEQDGNAGERTWLSEDGLAEADLGASGRGHAGPRPSGSTQLCFMRGEGTPPTVRSRAIPRP